MLLWYNDVFAKRRYMIHIIWNMYLTSPRVWGLLRKKKILKPPMEFGAEDLLPVSTCAYKFLWVYSELRTSLRIFAGTPLEFSVGTNLARSTILLVRYSYIWLTSILCVLPRHSWKHTNSGWNDPIVWCWFVRNSFFFVFFYEWFIDVLIWRLNRSIISHLFTSRCCIEQ